MRIVAAALVLAIGCASADPRPIAEDLVCLFEGDLGCVKVRVEEKTPRASYKGATYYFCCDECRAKFEKEPEKYLRAKPSPNRCSRGAWRREDRAACRR